ncbi:hypothetical protein GOBAR_AA15850 [Gossypium barbadense]|uniref:Uncharacterized protein n=1 Tax=Gossypium barbadense TaxID=3634 RepID=A0A2P5XNB4_GOSBA|nr:hypothetical protein GOBAR_AA15850 [Gossypium barbadense]
MQPILQEKSLKDTHKPCSIHNKGFIYEERRLQINELDERLTFKPRKHDKPKLCHDMLVTSPNQIKVGDNVLLDAADPRITTLESNEEIPLTVLSIFPYGTVEVSHPKFGTFKYTMSSSRGKKTTVLALKKQKGASSSGSTVEIRHSYLQFSPGNQEELFAIQRARPLGVGHCIDWTTLEQPTYLELILELFSTFHVQDVMTNFDDPRTVQFRLGDLVHQLSVPEFSIALGLYTEEFMNENNLDTLCHHIHYSPLKYRYTLVPGRRESTDVINIHDTYFLWSMENGYVLDLAYFIAFAIRHQTEWHQRGVISIRPYMTLLARRFGFLNTAAQSSSLSHIGQMSPQGISSMLSMRMIEKRRGTHPPQYCLAQSVEERDPEDITEASIADTIATNPANGNFPQGFSLRQGDVKFSVASGRTWINPVDNMTPAAKALMTKKMSFLGRKASIVFPSSGKQTPMALATRIETIAAILYFKASALFRSSSSGSHVQYPRTNGENKMKKKQRNVKSWVWLNLIMVGKL